MILKSPSLAVVGSVWWDITKANDGENEDFRLELYHWDRKAERNESGGWFEYHLSQTL